MKHCSNHISSLLSILAILCVYLFVSADEVVSLSNLNTPREGDTYPVDKVIITDYEKSGADLVWNFSDARILDGTQYIRYFSTDGQSIGRYLDHNREDYLYNGDSIYWKGIENRKVLLKDSIPALVKKMPFSYGDTLRSGFHFVGKKNFDRAMSDIGVTLTTADANGSVIFHTGDTIENMLRIKTDIFSNSDIRFRSSDLNEVYSDSLPKSLTRYYEWYASGYRYPLIIIRETYACFQDTNMILSDDAYICSPHEMAYAIKNDESNAKIRNDIRQMQLTKDIHDEDIPSTCIQDYEISVKNGLLELRLDLNINEDKYLELIICDSAAIPYKTIPKEKVTPGDNLIQIDCAGLPSGEYALMLLLENERLSLKFKK